MKSTVLLTFPRTGASFIVGTLRQYAVRQNQYVQIDDEVDLFRQHNPYDTFKLLNNLLYDEKLFITKTHVHRLILFSYTLILGAAEWINKNRNNINFLIMDRQDNLALCLSYLKAQYTTVWHGSYDISPITVPRFAVDKFISEINFARDFYKLLDPSIPTITYENIYQTKQDHKILADIIADKGPRQIEEISTTQSTKYNKNIENDFANLSEIKEWLGNLI